MFLTATFFLSLLLAFRSSVLAYFQKRQLDFVFSCFYLLLALLLFLKTDFSFSKDPIGKMGLFCLLASFVVGTLFLRLRKGYTRRSGFSLLKGCAFFVFVFFCLANLALSNFYSDDTILKVTLTGKHKKEIVQGKTLTVYEVLLEKPSGSPISQFYVYGDLIAIRAKVLRLSPALNLLGISNLCKIDALYNGYKTVERHNKNPSQAYSVPHKISFFSDFLWDVWELLYLQQSKSCWVKSATLESNYFPLVDQKEKPFCGSYLLTITEGGLSCLRN